MKREAAMRKRKKNEQTEQGKLGYRLYFREQAENTGHTTCSGGEPVSSEHRTVASNHLQVTGFSLRGASV